MDSSKIQYLYFWNFFCHIYWIFELENIYNLCQAKQMGKLWIWNSFPIVRQKEQTYFIYFQVQSLMHTKRVWNDKHANHFLLSVTVWLFLLYVDLGKMNEGMH